MSNTLEETDATTVSGPIDYYHLPSDADGRLVYFTYFPTNTAPEIAAALYLLVTIVLLIQIHRSRAQQWIYILAGTALAEAIGYGFRTACVYNTTFGLFVLMTLFLLLPPNALALVNYKTLGEIIRTSDMQPTRFWLRPRFVTWFFFASDLFSIAMQGTGGGMSTSDTLQTPAKAIALIGLCVQLVFFACFFFIAVYVWRKPGYVVAVGIYDKDGVGAKNKVMRVVVWTTVILYLRSIYRVAEFADGYASPVYRAEWAFYVFNTIFIFLTFVVYIVWFIGYNFVRDKALTGSAEGPVVGVTTKKATA